jgi:hypothetical protein
MKWAIAIIIIAHSFSASAQGTFQNLDFESANIPVSTPSRTLVSIAEEFPGWSASYTSGGVTLSATQVTYDGISTGSAAISIVDSSAATVIQGNYSAFLFAGGNGPGVGGIDGDAYSPTLSQTGAIPSGTESVLMDVGTHTTVPSVSIDGQSIDMVPLQAFVHYTLFGGNVSSFAGTVGTLSITEPFEPSGAFADAEIDNISFSPTAFVPEPNPLALTAIGGLLFGLYRWFSPKRH